MLRIKKSFNWYQFRSKFFFDSFYRTILELAVVLVGRLHHAIYVHMFAIVVSVGFIICPFAAFRSNGKIVHSQLESAIERCFHKHKHQQCQQNGFEVNHEERLHLFECQLVEALQRTW